jgi:putative addiction module killer protein
VQARIRIISVYVTASGTVPFDDWMNDLKDYVGKGAVEARIARLRLGALGKHANVGDGLIELKVDIGPGYRIYVADNGRDSLILCAGNKRTQKQDIKAAKKFWNDYQGRG